MSGRRCDKSPVPCGGWFEYSFLVVVLEERSLRLKYRIAKIERNVMQQGNVLIMVFVDANTCNFADFFLANIC